MSPPRPACYPPRTARPLPPLPPPPNMQHFQPLFPGVFPGHSHAQGGCPRRGSAITACRASRLPPDAASATTLSSIPPPGDGCCPPATVGLTRRRPLPRGAAPVHLSSTCLMVLVQRPTPPPTLLPTPPRAWFQPPANTSAWPAAHPSPPSSSHAGSKRRRRTRLGIHTQPKRVVR